MNGNLKSVKKGEWNLVKNTKLLTGSFSADLRGFLEELVDEERWLEWLNLDLDEDDVLDVDLWDTLFRIMIPSNMWHRFSSSPEKTFPECENKQDRDNEIIFTENILFPFFIN